MANAGGAWDNAKKYIEAGAPRRQGLRPAQGGRRRRHRRRPVQGHLRPGDEHPHQGDDDRQPGVRQRLRLITNRTSVGPGFPQGARAHRVSVGLEPGRCIPQQHMCRGPPRRFPTRWPQLRAHSASERAPPTPTGQRMVATPVRIVALWIMCSSSRPSLHCSSAGPSVLSSPGDRRRGAGESRDEQWIRPTSTPKLDSATCTAADDVTADDLTSSPEPRRWPRQLAPPIPPRRATDTERRSAALMPGPGGSPRQFPELRRWPRRQPRWSNLHVELVADVQPDRLPGATTSISHVATSDPY